MLHYIHYCPNTLAIFVCNKVNQTNIFNGESIAVQMVVDSQSVAKFDSDRNSSVHW